jgi:hypothetical protein
MEGATAEAALAGFTCILNRVHMPMRKTLTYDQGKEMSRHQDLTALTGVTVYFADPHSPWQRGSNENTNGLLRHYLFLYSSSADWGLRNPITGTAGCCAPAASGQATALPSPAMNWRLLIESPRRRSPTASPGW